MSHENDDEPPHTSPEDNDTDDKSDTTTIVAPSPVIQETAMPERREESLHDQDSMEIDKIGVATDDQDHVDDKMDPNDESDFRDIVEVADESNDDKKTKNAGGEQEITVEIDKDDSQESMEVVGLVAKNNTVDWDKQKKLGEALDLALDRLQEVNISFNVILVGDTFLRELFFMHCVGI